MRPAACPVLPRRGLAAPLQRWQIAWPSLPPTPRGWWSAGCSAFQQRQSLRCWRTIISGSALWLSHCSIRAPWKSCHAVNCNQHPAIVDSKLSTEHPAALTILPSISRLCRRPFHGIRCPPGQDPQFVREQLNSQGIDSQVSPYLPRHFIRMREGLQQVLKTEVVGAQSQVQTAMARNAFVRLKPPPAGLRQCAGKAVQLTNSVKRSRCASRRLLSLESDPGRAASDLQFCLPAGAR